MMWPRVRLTVHSPRPGSASQSAGVRPASAPWSSRRATAIAWRAGTAGPTGAPDRPSPRLIAIDAIADSSDSWIRYIPYRTSSSSMSDGNHRHRRSSGSSGTPRRSAAAPANGARVASTAGWSGTAGTVASSVNGSFIGQAYRPSASICRMTGRGPLDARPGFSLPIFDRISPAPPPTVVAARIESHTGPGDVVADLFGRGGWVSRAAIDRQRLTISLESSPLSRMLAEGVFPPPDVRHLHAAFQGMAASPRGTSSLKVSIGDMFATRCATCSRSLVVDEVAWSVDDDAGIAGRARPVSRHYRCTVCRDQRGGSEQRQAPLDADDLRRATADVGVEAMRARLLARFPIVA